MNFFYIQGIATRDPSIPDSCGARVVADLQHPSSNVRCIRGEKSFDIVAIDRLATVEPKIATDRCDSPEVAETHAPYRRHDSESCKALP